jgi:hypothetical protein
MKLGRPVNKIATRMTAIETAQIRASIVEKLEKNVNTVPFLYPPIEAEVKSMFNS